MNTNLPLSKEQKKNIPEWLRWILVLPTSIFVFIVVYRVVKFGNNICNTYLMCGPNNLWVNSMTEALSSGASAFAFIWFGTKVAPKHRFVVSIILAFILVFIMGMSFYARIILGDKSTTSWLYLAIAIIASIFAAVGAVWHFYEKQLNEIME